MRRRDSRIGPAAARVGPAALAGLAVLAALTLGACSPAPPSGPVAMVWDRDLCERCNMAIGDRHFAVQVRSPVDGRPHKFDDLGCALLWLDEQPWGRDGAFEIWVREWGGERWLDARRAAFLRAENTPMDYGFAAVAAATGESVGLESARERIREVERARRRPAR